MIERLKFETSNELPSFPLQHRQSAESSSLTALEHVSLADIEQEKVNTLDLVQPASPLIQF